jgi:phosphoglycolate phosphatase
MPRPSLSGPLPARVVFDLDGTLVDTAPDLCASLNHVLDRFGRPPVPVDDVRHMVGLGAAKLIERGMEATGGMPDDATEGAMMKVFLEHYGRNLSVTSRPFPNVVEALEALDEAGVLMAVCTNKPEGLARRLLADLDMVRLFPVILGGDSLPVKKPDAGHLIGTLARMTGPEGSAVMVGDSQTDLSAARNAGLPAVLVTFGYTPVPAAELGADALIDDFAELAGVLGRFA